MASDADSLDVAVMQLALLVGASFDGPVAFSGMRLRQGGPAGVSVTSWSLHGVDVRVVRLGVSVGRSPEWCSERQSYHS